MPLRLRELSYIELIEKIGSGQDMIVLPVGTLEAHGKHLPLGTDTLIAEGISERIADATGAILAPPMEYGITNSLFAYPGGSRCDEEIYAEFILGALDGFINAGFRKVIIVNGHGGNTQPIHKLIKEITSEYPDKLFIAFDWWSMDSDIVKEVYGGGSGHAGLDETAGIIYFNPRLVKENLYDEDDWYLRTDGYIAYPIPAPIILEDDESLPDFDATKAEVFFDKVLDRLISRVSRDISLWESNFGRDDRG